MSRAKRLIEEAMSQPPPDLLKKAQEMNGKFDPGGSSEPYEFRFQFRDGASAKKFFQDTNATYGPNSATYDQSTVFVDKDALA